ncbi:MAG: hypothetical protein LCH96_13380 [Actinobacteria bacterium]|nr:hypothetical protein [Actinomycetota bacterium]
MSVLQDLVTEIESYPHTYLTIEIIDVNPPGSAINVNEDVTFTVQVSNSGPLNVRDLTLTVTGLNGTQVKAPGAAAPWGTEADSNPFDLVPAHQPNTPVVMTGSPLHFKANRAWSTAKDLVSVTVGDWDTDFDHPLIAHSDPDTAAKATYSSTVAAA